MNKCPCCGAPCEAKFLVDLNTNTIVIEGRTIKVFPTSAVIAHALLKNDPRVTTAESLLQAMYGDPANEPEKARHGLTVHVYHLRRSLLPFGWTVQFINGAGYKLARSVEGNA
jgi:DNA-binding response OmpR family regulator